MANEYLISILIKAKDEASSVLGGLSNIAGNVLTGALGIATAGVGALGAGLASTIGPAMDAQLIAADLEATLKSTGGAAGVTAEMANDLASQFQNLTKFEGDSIVKGESMLLTFTQIGKDVFPQATEAMLNMAQKFGSMDSAAVQLGKALNDPVKGVAALREVGVSLTQQQADQVKAFVDAGRVADAQRVILKELEVEFGGLAVAAGQTAAGKMERFKNTLGDIQETIGGALLPVIAKFADMLSNALASDEVQNAIAGIAESVDVLSTSFMELVSGNIPEFIEGFPYSFVVLAKAFGVSEDAARSVTEAITQGMIKAYRFLVDSVFPAVNQAIQFMVAHWEEFKGALIAVGAVLGGAWLVTTLTAIGAAIAALASPVVLVIGAVALLGAAWAGNWGGIRDKTAAVVAWLQANVLPVIQNIVTWAVENWPAFRDAVVAAFEKVKQAVTAVLVPVLAFAGKEMGKVVAWVRENWPLIQKTAVTVFNTIKTVVTAVLGAVYVVVKTVLDAIAAFWKGHGEDIMQIVKVVWLGIKTAIDNTLTVIMGIIKAVMQAINGDWAGAWQTIKETAATVWDNIKALISAALTALWNTIIKPALDGIKKTFEDAWKAISDYITDTWNTIRATISAALASIQNALKTAWDAIVSAAQTAWQNLGQLILAALDAIEAIVTTALENVKTIILAAWEFINADIPTKWAMIQASLQVAIDLVKGVVSNAFAAIQAAVSTAWTNIKAGVSGAWALIKAEIETAVNNAKNVVASGFEAVKGAVAGAWVDIKNGVSGAWESITAEIKSAIESIPGAVATAVSSVGQIGSSIVATIKGAISAAWAAAGGVVSILYTKLSSLWNDVWDGTLSGNIAEIGSSILSSISGAISSLWGSANGVFTVLWDHIAALATDLFDGDLGARIAATGRAIINNIIQGIINNWEYFINWLRDQIAGIFGGASSEGVQSSTVNSASISSSSVVSYNLYVNSSAPVSTVVGDFNLLRSLVNAS